MSQCANETMLIISQHAVQGFTRRDDGVDGWIGVMCKRGVKASIRLSCRYIKFIFEGMNAVQRIFLSVSIFLLSITARSQGNFDSIPSHLDTLTAHEMLAFLEEIEASAKYVVADSLNFAENQKYRLIVVGNLDSILFNNRFYDTAALKLHLSDRLSKTARKDTGLFMIHFKNSFSMDLILSMNKLLNAEIEKAVIKGNGTARIFYHPPEIPKLPSPNFYEQKQIVVNVKRGGIMELGRKIVTAKQLLQRCEEQGYNVIKLKIDDDVLYKDVYNLMNELNSGFISLRIEINQ